MPAAPVLLAVLVLRIAFGFPFPEAPGALGGGGRDNVSVRIQWLS